VRQMGSRSLSLSKLIRRCGRRFLRAYNAHSPVQRGKVRAVKVLGPYLIALEPSEIVAYDSITMELDLQEFVQQYIYFNVYEPHVKWLLRSLLEPGKSFFDIGAHVGYYTLLAAHAVGPKGVIHSFEANPGTFELLSKNVRRNDFGRILLNRVALTDMNGEVRFCIDEIRPASSSLSGKGADRLTELSVPSVTLDSYIESNSVTMLDLIKIDIEGGEVRVFRGGQETLSRFRPDIVGEFSKEMMTRESTGEQEMIGLLKSLRYQAFTLRGNRLRPIGIERIYDTGEWAADLYLTARGVPERCRKWVAPELESSTIAYG
jgi:FkbM family methyltransferase